MTVTFRINFSEIHNRVRSLEADFSKAKQAAVTKMGNKLLMEVKKRAPVETGQYRDSWRVISKGGKRIRVGTPKRKLFQMLEFTGTKPHVIEPRQREALRFESDHGEVFAKEVIHPGTKPQPHARPALRYFMEHESAKMLLREVEKASKLFPKQN